MADQPELFPESHPGIGAAAATPRRRAARQRQMAEQVRTVDSFQNFGLNLGLGTDNALTGSTYGLYPITRIRTLLEWIYRGSWMGAVAVDLVANDMTRAGVEVHTDLKPEQIEEIQRNATSLGIWTGVCDTEKWARLYGGAIGVMLIDGQDMATLLREDTIMPGQFKGLAVFDRWSVTQSTSLVTAFGPNMGLPEWYTIGNDAPGLRGQRVHYTRCLRLVGIELPWNQRVAENMWGLSVIERIYDRMVAFDSATQGAAQLVYKAAIRTYKIKGMRALVAAGGDSMMMLMRYTDMVRKFASNEGMTLIDADDDMVTTQLQVQAGISDALVQFGQQLSGALQIPLVRLFGQSPAGLNATGESDLRTYYDAIANQQRNELLEPMLKIYRIITRSLGFKVDKRFNIEFRPLWQLDEVQKSEVAERDARTIADLKDAGLYDDQTALRELKTSSKTTARFQNITDEMIEQAEDTVPDASELLGDAGGDGVKQIGEKDKPLLLEDKRDKADRRASTGDAIPARDFRGMQLMIETAKGERRHGPGWEVDMPADYGFIRGTSSAEGMFEQMDCFVGPDAGASYAYVIDSATPEGEFDEHKVMLGFTTEADAKLAYGAAYHDARRPMGCTALSIDELKAWLGSGDVTEALASTMDGYGTTVSNQGISHMGSRGPGSQAVCGNSRAHMTLGREQFEAESPAYRCKKCEQKLERWNEIKRKRSTMGDRAPYLRAVR